MCTIMYKPEDIRRAQRGGNYSGEYRRRVHYVTEVEIDWDQPGEILSRVARIILVCLFRVPCGCPFYHRSKSTGGGIKMAAAICTVEAAIFTILK